MLGGLGYAAVRMAARRPAAPVAGDKALQKTMAEVMMMVPLLMLMMLMSGAQT